VKDETTGLNVQMEHHNLGHLDPGKLAMLPNVIKSKTIEPIVLDLPVLILIAVVRIT
jgi:hypothetical protein